MDSERASIVLRRQIVDQSLAWWSQWFARNEHHPQSVMAKATIARLAVEVFERDAGAECAVDPVVHAQQSPDTRDA